MSDVLKALKDMQDRFYRDLGNLNGELSQHEKHLTWMSGYYADMIGLTASDAENKPYFSQKYNNHTFVIGYRIGLAEKDKSYDQGYEDGKREAEYRILEALGLNLLPPNAS